MEPVTEPVVDANMLDSTKSNMTREQILAAMLTDCILALESPELNGMFTLAHVHGMEYQGPSVNVAKMKHYLTTGELLKK